MKTAIISSKALGSRCWDPHRVLGACHRCQRYDTCKYPERVPTPVYDAVRREAGLLQQKAARLYERTREM